VDEAGQHFLAGAGLAVDQHRAVGGGDARCQRVQRAGSLVDHHGVAVQQWRVVIAMHGDNKSKFHAGDTLPIP
jgi:hypothetical protein